MQLSWSTVRFGKEGEGTSRKGWVIDEHSDMSKTIGFEYAQ